MKHILKIISLLLLLIIVGCSNTRKRIKSQTSLAPAKLAILPLDNYTNDVEGSILLRNIIHTRLKENNKGYEIQELTKTDELLRDAGITDGGQLNVFDPIELNEILQVDGLLMLRLDEMELFTIPYYHVRKIEMSYKLYNLGKLYEDKPLAIANRFLDIDGIIDTLGEPKEGFNDALVDMAIHQGIGIVTGVLADHPLKPEMEMMASEVARSIPYGQRENKVYLEGIEEKLKKLSEAIDEDEELPLKEVEETEEVEATERGIIIVN